MSAAAAFRRAALAGGSLLAGCPDDETATPSGSESSSTSGTTHDVTTSTTADTSSESLGDSTSTSQGTTTSDTTTGDPCGDGQIGPAESCDGDDLDKADCVSLGFLGGRLSCDGACAYDTSECIAADCGDNVIEGDEVCDGPSLGGQSCASQGFFAGTLQCGAGCRTYDTSSCFASICGNGTIEGAELCDGALVGSDCESEGFVGGALRCAADCLGYDQSDCFVCGNDEVEGDETCDGDELGDITCFSLGFVGGRPTCADDCTIESTGSCYGSHTYCAMPAIAIGPEPGAVLTALEVEALAGDVVDVDVSVVATHARVADLALAIQHVDSGTAAVLMNLVCGGDASDIDATFDQDVATAIDCIEPVAVEGPVAPVGDLDVFAAGVGNGGGTWRLEVTDVFAGNGGTLEQWCVAITNEQPTEHTLYVANDAAPNSVSAFSIAADGGLASLMGSPFGTGSNSEFDHHPDAIVDCGGFVYVANYPAGISAFVVAPDGVLSAVAGSPFPTNSVVSLACDSDGHLFASDFGTSIERYQIANDGGLVSLGGTQAAAATLGMTYHDGSDRLFVAGFNGQLGVFDHDGLGDLAEAPGSPYFTDGNNHSASVDPSGSLVALEAFGGVNMYAVADDGSLALVEGSPFVDPTLCETVGLAWSPDGERLFVGHRNCAPGMVMVYEVANDGVLTPVAGAPFPTGGVSPVGLAVRSTGTQLFVSHAGDASTAVLAIAPDGSLAAIAGSPFANPVAGGHPWLIVR